MGIELGGATRSGGDKTDNSSDGQLAGWAAGVVRRNGGRKVEASV